MDQLICAHLSHTHYWYEVGTLKVPWVAFGDVVKDGRDWMTAAKNVGKWHRRVERGAEALDSAWRRADLRQSNVQRQREVSEVIQ